jgi:hypothetical protein
LQAEDKLNELELRLVKVEIKMAEREQRWDERMESLQDSIDGLKKAVVWSVCTFITSALGAGGTVLSYFLLK